MQDPIPAEGVPDDILNTSFTPEVINDIFSYHSPTPDQLPKYEAVREGARQFAQIIIANTPACPDQWQAIRKLREAVMTANASIALDGRH